MNEQTKKAIEFLSGKITGDVSADEALKFTQAALNLAHTEATLHNTELQKV